MGALLHGADRRARGLEPTDLEQRLLDLAEAYLPGDELVAFGGVYRDAVTRGPVDVLPEAVTGLPVETGYGLADLLDALPAIGEHALAQPNVRVVDVTALDGDAPIDDEEFAAALVEYGRGTTILTAPGPQATDVGPASAPLRLHSFHCDRKSGEVGRDEIYWALAAGSDGRAKTSGKTREYGSTSTSTWHTFDANTFLFNGEVEKYVSCEIQCWEADDSSGGFYNSLRGALADFAEAALDLSVRMAEAGDDESKKAAGLAAWFAIGAGLLNAILGWLTNDDDLVVERSFTFDRAALAELASRPKGEFALLFDGGGGGRHTLYLHCGPFVERGGPLRTTTLGASGGWAPGPAVTSGTTAHTPALAAYRGGIHCLVRGLDAHLWHNSFDGTRWTAFTRLPMASTVTPALAALGDRLHAVHRSSHATGTLYWNHFDGTRWSAAVALSGTTTDHAPALVVFNGRLHCLAVEAGSARVTWSSFDGTRWSAFTGLPNYAAGTAAPAAAAFGGKLHLVCRGHGDSGVLRWSTFDGTTWTPSDPLPSGTTGHAPALAVANNKLHCLVRGSGANRTLYSCSHDGTRWNNFTPLGVTSPLPPGLTTLNNTLYAAYIA
ncbi:hypothetical protein [Saccharothrix xinjiangensis]|uniref:PLL-like beta propeller domain-containing protein n=1 Tax=Saccharothrix xinjiangensis TaxID=204798 RepID=A0ABV9Y2U4_9PSEU